MIEFYFRFLIIFFILNLHYIEIFVLNFYRDNISYSKLIFLTLSIIMMILYRHLIYNKDLK